ncbi:MAG: DUF423 domain-containing protein [Brevundimonas sp.]|uniref:DUF423 domain-containing protein n=1 Tax=Brevundimonas albigilva TaxID=1312364 RepID=A0ABY4SG85_9CAUL|nr:MULTISPECIES: DUF423 domain-containing protein [Brevundimonas]PZU57246.1 MAG: DUF423 domain-containing protein [Brevundimonas sp.]UQV17981.1 DUF423 domain-containing protein [Brevundimonas albigilva]URI14037.1 DUF423 domain-containing protein [Brevundimonas albigilva]
MASRDLIVFSALNGALAVALGAFAAHGAGLQVKTLLTTGAHYQLAHAVFGLACALWTGGGRLARLAGWLGAAGGLVFSLALAFIALLSLPAMGAVAPVGGVLMIAGWLCVAFAALQGRSS